MRTTTIAPGLVITDEQYQLAADAIHLHAPHAEPLSWEDWSPPSSRAPCR